MKRYLIFALILTFMLSLTACATPPVEAPQEAAAEQTALTLPEDFWSYVDGSTATLPISETLYQRFSGGSAEDATKAITHNKTWNAYNNLASGQAQLIFVLEPDPEIVEMFAEQGIEIEFVPIVKDAFVLMVNEQNPVQSLTIPQLRDIYVGNIQNWKTVGGEDLQIIPYQRNEASGSQSLFLMLLMKDAEPMLAPEEYIHSSMADIIEAVAYDQRAQAAIGFNVFYYANVMYEHDEIRLLQVEGVLPSQETIARGEYPLESYYYAVFRKDTPENHPIRQLVDFILTDEGQHTMQDLGYVPVRVLD